MIYADDAINVINQYRTEEIVLTTMTPGRYWKEISKKPEIDFPVYGVMRKASSVGLGLSLAKPSQKILVFRWRWGTVNEFRITSYNI